MEKPLSNSFGMRSQFENNLNFAKKVSIPEKEEPQPQDQVILQQTQLDMLLASQKMDGRLGSLSRLRTSINFNEFIRLTLLVAGTIFGYQNTLTLKQFLPAVVAAQQIIVSRRSDILDDNMQSVDPWSLYPQEAMKLHARQKLLELIISFVILLLTLNYYRLVLKLTTLRDGMFRQDLNWVTIAIKLSMVFVHSQAKWNYLETFKVGGQKGEEPQSLYDNRRIFYNDQAITAVMIVFRLGYFVPKILLRLYSLTVNDVPKTKHRYIITEKTALLDTRNYQLKYLFHFHKTILFVILIIQILAFSCIYQIFNWSSSKSLDDYHEIKPSKQDEFFNSLFQTANMIFRQQFRQQMKTFFISDPPPEPVVQQTDPNVQYITAKATNTTKNTTALEEPVINTAFMMQQIYPENNALLTVCTFISFVGSLFFTTFLINMFSQIDRPMSSIRFQNIMIDILQNKRGLIRTYSSNLIQAYFRIRKYQKLCNFEGQGTIRPGIENMKIYTKNKSELLKNIGLFRYNKFLIRQYRERQTGIDQFAVEYQQDMNSVPFRLHRFVQDSVKKLQEQIIDKMRYKTLVILNEKVNRNDLDLILSHQQETIQILGGKLRAMQQTNIFLNKIQTTYLKEDQNEFNPKMPLLRIDTFPEIISDTSLKNMSDKDFAIKLEDIDEARTEQNRILRSDHYSIQNAEELDTNSLKYKLQQMKKKLEADLAEQEETSHRQININIRNKKGRVGFAKGTNKPRRSKMNSKSKTPDKMRKNSKTPDKKRKSVSGERKSKNASAEKIKVSRRNTISGERVISNSNSRERKTNGSLPRSDTSETVRLGRIQPNLAPQIKKNLSTQIPKTIVPNLEKINEVPNFEKVKEIPNLEKVKQVIKKASPFRKMKTKKDGPSGGIFLGGFNQIF